MGLSEREDAPLLFSKAEGEPADEPRSPMWSSLTLIATLCIAVGLTTFFSMLVRIRHEHSTLSTLLLESPFPQAAHPLQPSALWGSLEPPYPTGAWWSNLVLGDGAMPVVALPYAVAVSPKAGVEVSYSAARRVVTPTLVQDPFAADVALSAVETIRHHSVQGYDAVSVTVCMYTATGSLCSPLVKGSPFVTVLLTNVTPRLTAGDQVMAVNGAYLRDGATVAGTQFALRLATGAEWLLVSEEKVTLRLESGTLMATGPVAHGVWRVAAVPSDAARRVLLAHSAAYPTGGDVGLSYNEDFTRAFVTLRWKRKGPRPLLMLALPHHVDSMPRLTPALRPSDSFLTIKGTMTGVTGDSWVMEEPLTSIRWSAKNPIRSPSQLQDIRVALQQDMAAAPPSAPDSYTFGKQLGRLARLCLIAEEVGLVDVLRRCLTALDAALAPWLQGTNPNALLYDITYGGVCTHDGLRNAAADYGNGYYNDHHFHYGYFVYAAAVLAKHRREAFLAKHGPAMSCLIGDIANLNPNWRLFPVARHKDFFDGHSWASGLFPQHNGKSQESVSEAANAYYAVSLYGHAIRDPRMMNHGRVLLALELHAARRYWQMPAASTVYPASFRAHRMVGVVAAAEARVATWFSASVEHIHCINMLPFTPITEELLSPSYVAEEYPLLRAALARPTAPVAEEWRGFIALAHAVVDPGLAWDEVQDL
eukprot:EG_transcript_4617